MIKFIAILWLESALVSASITAILVLLAYWAVHAFEKRRSVPHSRTTVWVAHATAAAGSAFAVSYIIACASADSTRIPIAGGSMDGALFEVIKS